MNQYFKGYYFKCSTGVETVAFIPALHADGKKRSASLQVITEEAVYEIPFPAVRFTSDPFCVRIGENTFSEQGIFIDIDANGCRIHGKLQFGDFFRLRYGIMGPFRFVPFMQCKHSIVSMRHAVAGNLQINDRVYRFDRGTGYIEGDRGRSFPKEYLWTQCIHNGASLMLAAADIPFLGLHFKGVIGAVQIGAKEYRIATYLGAKIIFTGAQAVLIKQGKYTLYAKLLQTNHQKLKAPVRGKMTRTIHESVSCRAYYKFMVQEETLLEFTSERASFEFEI